MKAIIVDDELNARLALSGILEENFPDVEIIDMCQNIPDAVISINKNKPELVFLDISMPGYSGLELFNFFDDKFEFKVIFVTAYNEYALDAFEKSAVDYILKPVRITDLERALNKLHSKTSESIENLRDKMDVGTNKKVVLNTGEGLIFLVLDDILYLKADGAYTHFITREDRKITVTKKISDFEKLETMGSFLRIHRSQMINYNCIKKIVKQNGGRVIMDNGDELAISIEKKQVLLNLLNNQIL